MFNFNNFKTKAAAVEEWLVKEMSFIRTGRALPSILDAVSVEAYGGRMAVKELASISVEDPRVIRVEPWDKTQTKAIEKGIQSANLGLSVNSDEKGLRVIFPELTSERREQVIKLAKNKLEESRITLRGLRDEVMKEIEAKEKEGGMGEDDKFRFKEELQKMVEALNTKLEEMFERKEKEIKE
jgi:ribosome recycling factor